VYAIAAFWLLGLHRWRPAQWRQLEERVQPPTVDMFAAADHKDQAKQVDKVIKSINKKPVRPRRSRAPRTGFVHAGNHYG
jgi:hypothetical protein